MSGNVKEVVSWLGMLGIPTIFAIAMSCVRSCYKFSRQMNILMTAQKAQMRSQLLEQFHAYEEAGWISEEHLQDWMNQHAAYHELVGPNGVLEARKEVLIHLPNKPQK